MVARTLAAVGVGRYVVGVLTLGATFASAVAGALALRRRLLAQWRGAPATLADAVLAIAIVVLGCELAGAVGQFRRAGVVIATAVVAGAAAVVASRRTDSSDVAAGPSAPETPPSSRPAMALAAISVTALAAQWGTRLGSAFASGITDVDTMTYHLPFAARFMQTGDIGPLHYTGPGEANAFHPANAELLHALGLAAFGSDVLSLAVNMAWVALAVLAAWCIGRPWGRGPDAVVALCLVLSTPLIARTQAATAMNDVAAVALLLAAVAVLVSAPPSTPVTFVAAVAAGLAVGTKLTVVPAVAALAVVAIVATARGRRLRTGVAWLACGVVTSGYWYGRNLLAIGSPIPALDLGIGPLRFPQPHIDLLEDFGASVADYATDGRVWRAEFLPALGRTLGPGWWALLGAAVVGAVIAARLESRLRAPAAAVVAALAGYVVTPTSAFGPRGNPVLFEENVRYLLPALALGLTLLASCLPDRRIYRGAAAVAAVTVLVATHLRGGPAPAWLPDHRAVAVVVASIVMATLVIAVAVTTGRMSRRVVTLVACCALTVAAVGGWSVQERYLRTRYATYDEFASSWARGVDGARIGFAGFFTHYGLYGLRATNYVQYVGRVRDDGSFTDVADCEEWRRALAEGNYDFVVVAPAFVTLTEQPEQAEWTRSDPAAEEILRRDAVSVFELRETPTPRC